MGSFILDLVIVKIFAQVGMDLYLGIVAYLGKGSGVSLSFTDSLALPVLLTLYIMLLLVFIGVYMGYHWVCYAFLKTSLSRYFLGLKVVSDKGQPLEKSLYMRREFEKIVWSVATLGLYVFYCGAQYLTFSNPPMHDKRNHTQVVES
ncbi:RDD family protein [Vibrio salinus]|uniref:RDD family protein n=1 Tax=Vibrio salinus TaxID=2899784 RepID=UPI002151A79D|nr:RDD family protein [Vibrio salinus]